MMGKFYDFCSKIDDDFEGLGAVVFVSGMTFAVFFFSVILVGSVYKLSGAAEKDRLEEIACQEAGGKLIYVKGTGDVCISGVIELKEVE